MDCINWFTILGYLVAIFVYVFLIMLIMDKINPGNSDDYSARMLVLVITASKVIGYASIATGIGYLFCTLRG